MEGLAGVSLVKLGQIFDLDNICTVELYFSDLLYEILEQHANVFYSRKLRSVPSWKNRCK